MSRQVENNSIYIVVTPFFPSPISWRGAYCYDFVRVLDRQQELKVGVESSCAMSTEVKGWDESSLVTGSVGNKDSIATLLARKHAFRTNEERL